MSRSQHKAVLLIVRRAPALPAALLDQLLATGPTAHPALQCALLRRTDVPLARLQPWCQPTGDLPPQAAAAYLSRPEHAPETIAELLDDDPRPELIHAIVAARLSRDAAVAAALPRCTPDLLRSLASNTEAPIALRGTALARLADLAAAAEPAPDRKRWEDATNQLEEVLEHLTTPLAEAAAPHSSDPTLLAACARHVRDPAVADHIARAWLAPLLTAGPIPADRANSTMSAAYWLSRRVSATGRAELAGWVQAATLDDPDSLGPGYNLPDLVVQLRGGQLLERRWSAALFDDNLHDPMTDLAQLVAAELGDDPARWSVYASLADEFPGTVAELLATVRTVAAR